MTKDNWFQLAAAIIICELAGVVGSIFTTPAIKSWYLYLPKPDLAPPNWVFAPVWTTLFALMGLAAYLVWRKKWNSKEKRKALFVFALQLVLNTIWSGLFFGLKNIGLAFFELVLLWLSIAATIYYFSKISRAAAWLLVPYIMWVSFAGYLNLSFWLNATNAGPESIGGGTDMIACTMDAKMCPDGSYVGRVAPKCEFAPCSK